MNLNNVMADISRELDEKIKQIPNKKVADDMLDTFNKIKNRKFDINDINAKTKQWLSDLGK